jgi:outer membrane autotransporter protein
MTKNKFLSKRLACLLTSALIASPVLFSTSIANADDVTLNGAAGTTFANTDTILLTDDETIELAAAADTAVSISTVAAASTLSIAGGTLTLTGGTSSGAQTLAITLLDFDDPMLAGSLTIQGSVTEGVGATTITLQALTTLTFNGANDATIAASINAEGEAQLGTLAIAGTGVKTFNDTIGTSATDRILSITVAEGSTAVFNAAVFAASSTVSGTATFAAATAIPTLTTAATGITTLSGVLTAATEAVVDGILIINAPSQLITEINLNAGGIILVNKTLVSGNTINTGTTQTLAGIDAGGEIILPSNLIGGQTLIIRDTGDMEAGVGAAIQAVLTNNALSTYTAVQSGDPAANAEIVTITSTNKSASTTASELGVNTNKAKGLLQARDAAAAANTAGTDTAAIDAIFNVLNAANGQSATADTNFANQVAPQTDTIAGSSVAAKAVTSGVQNIMSTRLASLRSGDAFSTGVVTGSGMSANSGFIQAFGSTVEQKNKGNEFGYDADTTGFALGIDGKVSDGVVVGISYANSKTDVDGKGTGKAKNDIKTNSGSLYADYTTKDGYVEGSITYGQSDNTGSRILNTGGLNRTYKSAYDSEQYSLRLSGGVPINLGAGAFFTPFAGATISQIKTDAYTETSTTANDALRLRVAQDTVDSQVGTVGIKYHQAIKDGKTTFTPEVKLAVNQEFGDDTITSTNTYQGGGASFKNSTAIEKTSATAGVGLNITSDNVSFNIGYEADAREKYLGHSAQAKITAKF